MIHSILHFIFNVTIVIMDIFQLICLINILTYDFSKFAMIENLYKNWSHNFIKKIKIEYQSSSKNINTENIEPLINISFPGIIPGCDCSLYNNKIYKGNCPNDLLNKNCYDIEPIEQNNLNNLYLSENAIGIYIERYDNLSYLDLINNNEDFFISEKECNCDKYKKYCFDCGIIDSLGNHLCVTSYKGIDNNCYKIGLEYDYSLKNTKLIQDLNMIFNNTRNNSLSHLQYPIEFITLYNSNKTCILQDESITFPNIDYNLIYYNNITTLFNPRTLNKGCISELFFKINMDYRWITIYPIPINNLFSPLLKKELNKLPLFPYEELINNKNIYLTYRNFIGIKNKCINITIFIKDNLISYEKLLKIRFLLLMFFSLIFFPSFLLFFMMIYQIDILSFIQKMIFGITFSTNICIFLESLYLEFNDMKNKYEIINIFANNFCGDDLTNNLFFCILNDFKNLQSWTLFCCYWTVIMLLASICKISLIVTKTCKKRIMLSLNFGNSHIITQVEIQLLT